MSGNKISPAIDPGVGQDVVPALVALLFIKQHFHLLVLLCAAQVKRALLRETLLANNRLEHHWPTLEDILQLQIEGQWHLWQEREA